MILVVYVKILLKGSPLNFNQGKSSDGSMEYETWKVIILIFILRIEFN